MAAAHHHQGFARGARMLRTALGPAIARHLEDPSVVEVMLNPDGRLWIDRLSEGLGDTDAFDELAQAAAAPTGTLRITAPNDYGTALVAPLVSAFTARYPACRVELTLSDDTVDLVSGRIDLAIRVGWLLDSSLQARKIGSFDQLLVASPVFADRIAPLRAPEDLDSLPFIANLALRDPLLWSFTCGDLDRQTARLQATIAIDTTPGVLAAVKAGGGLSILPDFLVAEDLAAGRLINVLPAWELPSGGIHTVYPTARFRPPKVTAFVDMLVDVQKKTSIVAAP